MKWAVRGCEEQRERELVAHAACVILLRSLQVPLAVYSHLMVNLHDRPVPATADFHSCLVALNLTYPIKCFHRIPNFDEPLKHFDFCNGLENESNFCKTRHNIVADLLFLLQYLIVCMEQFHPYCEYLSFGGKR